MDGVDARFLYRRVADGQIGPAEAAWLISAIRTHAAAKGTLSLEACLRLPTTQRRWNSLARDVHLREAWQLVRKPTDQLTSKALAGAINYFETRVLPGWLNDKSLVANGSALWRALWAARNTGVTIPRSAKRLHDLYACPGNI